MIWSGQAPEHDADHCETDESRGGSGVALEVSGEASVVTDPGQGPFDDPAFGQHHELACIRAFDDFDVDLFAGLHQSLLEARSLIAAVGVEFQQKREHSKQRAHHQNSAVAILNVRRMHDRVEQKALRVYQEMALLALDLLASIVAVGIDAGPPFSALLTLWLSMIAAVGLASRPACSRHRT